jgi:flagellar basal-body rod modification protein FlgD
MSYQVSANYAVPPVSNTPKPAVSGGTAKAASTTTGSTTSSSDTTTSTFLNLLVKELQNQDPTAPVDSTAMVGQMISLNQLDQLISINSALTPSVSATAAG